jgi:mono/diheme cytochrome c family protein
VPASDVHAIATFMADVFGAPHKERSRETVVAQAKSTQGKTADTQGATIYAAACAGCHESDRPPPYGGINFALSSALSAPDPRNLINIVLAGVRPVEGERSPIMPGFAVTMNDRQIAVLVNYLRSRFTGQPAWSGLETVIEQARRTQTAYLTTSAGPASAPAGVAQRDKP